MKNKNQKHNHICISRNKERTNRYLITSSNEFFNNNVMIEINNFSIIIRVAELHENYMKTSRVNKYSVNVGFYTDYEIPLGRYEISEDSTEDKLIIDWNN